MNREDIIRMAREAGLYSGNPRTPGTENTIVRRLTRFAALVAAQEREACAKENAELLQALQNLYQRCYWADAPDEMDAAEAAIGKAIRKRGEVQP